MSDPRITDEAVEVAAEALYEAALVATDTPSPGWDDEWVCPRNRDTWRNDARAALEAALPHLAPQPAVDREALEKALRSVLAREGVDEFHDLQPLGWKLADAVIDLLNGTAK